MGRFIFAVIMGGLFLSGGAQASEKTFVYCSEASPTTFNPQLVDDGPTFNASSQMIYNRLVEFEPTNTKVIPALAEKWEISKDGKTYTFHLRKGVQFQTTEYFKPTRNLNADDVIFSFERPMKKDNPYHNVGGGTYPYFISMQLDHLIEKIEKVDDLTVRFTLIRPEAPFLSDVALSFAVILSKEYADQLQKAGAMQKLDTTPVGTGPFILKRYVKDNSIRYEANPTYWAGRAKLDKVVFAITPEPSVRFQKLKAGECHLIAEPSPQDLDGIAKAKNLVLLKQAGANVGYLAFNVEKPPFNKVEVREAIAMAMNRDYYIKVIYNGTAIPAAGPLPPTVWGADPKLKPVEYNVEKARALMAKAGFSKGFSTEIWTLPVSRPYNPNGKKMGELMQADLAKIGIQVKLVTFDWSTYLAKARNGDHQMIQVGWTTDNGDPDNFLGTLLTCAAIPSGGNYARWCNKAYDKLIVKAKLVTAIPARTAQYIKAQALFRAALPWVPLVHATVFRGVAKSVKGYAISPLGTENFYPIDLK